MYKSQNNDPNLAKFWIEFYVLSIIGALIGFIFVKYFKRNTPKTKTKENKEKEIKKKSKYEMLFISTSASKNENENKKYLDMTAAKIENKFIAPVVYSYTEGSFNKTVVFTPFSTKSGRKNLYNFINKKCNFTRRKLKVIIKAKYLTKMQIVKRIMGDIQKKKCFFLCDKIFPSYMSFSLTSDATCSYIKQIFFSKKPTINGVFHQNVKWFDGAYIDDFISHYAKFSPVRNEIISSQFYKQKRILNVLGYYSGMDGFNEHYKKFHKIAQSVAMNKSITNALFNLKLKINKVEHSKLYSKVLHDIVLKFDRTKRTLEALSNYTKYANYEAFSAHFNVFNDIAKEVAKKKITSSLTEDKNKHAIMYQYVLSEMCSNFNNSVI